MDNSETDYPFFLCVYGWEEGGERMFSVIYS